MSHVHLRSSRQLKIFLLLCLCQGVFSQEVKTLQKNKKSTTITKANIQANETIDTWTHQRFSYLKKKLEQDIFETTLHPVAIGSIFIVILLSIIYMTSLFLRIFLSKYLSSQIKQKIKSQKEQKEFNRILNGIFPLFALLGARFSIVSLESLLGIKVLFIKSLLNAGVIIMLSILFKRILMSLIHIWSKRLSQGQQKVAKQLLPLTVGLSKVIIFSFAFILSLSFLGINIAPFIASLGALTFAVGFAIKDSLSNFIAGILLIIDDSFLVGDKIDIPKIGLGYIHEIHLRTTRVLTFDNEIIVIPNNLLMNKEYKNYRLPNETIRIVVDFTVAYGTKVDTVKKAIIEILDQDSDILDQPKPVVEFISMADFYLAFKAKGYVSSYDNQYNKTIELTEKIYETLNAKNIPIPFPTHTVHMVKEGVPK